MAALTKRLMIGASFDTPEPVPLTDPAWVEAFFDADDLDDVTGLTFDVNLPTKYASNPIFPPEGSHDHTWDQDKLYVSTFKIGGTWHMFYKASDSNGNRATCYAHSSDGINWTRPSIGRHTYDGSTDNNLVMDAGAEMGHALYDAYDDQWYLLLETDGPKSDGLYLYRADVPEGPYSHVRDINVGGEARNIVRRPDGRWIAYRRQGTPRDIYAMVSDTEDASGSWGASVRVLEAPSSTEQYYGIGVHRTGQLFYGFALRYNSTTEQLWIDLYTSPDGLTWTARQTEWIPVGGTGDFDEELVLTGTLVAVDGDLWHVYYTGAPQGHDVSPRDSRIGRATIDRSRVGQLSGTGEATTVYLEVAEAATLTVNADASGGTLDIEVQDDAGNPLVGFAQADFDTITTDEVDAVPTWDGQPMPDDRTLRLKFVTTDATLYGYTISDAVKGTGADFDPLSIDWHAAFWAEGPLFEAENYSANDPVPTFPDEAENGRHATQGTAANQPTFRSSVAAFNNRPTVETVSSDYLTTSAWTALSQPTTIVAVGSLKGTGNDSGSYMCDGITSGSRHGLFHRSSADDVSIFAGSSLNGGTKISGAHLFIATFDGGSSTIERNGNLLASGDAGGHSLTGLTLFTYFGADNFFGEHIAFLAVLDGTLTSQQKDDLLSWAQEHYGTPS